MHIPYRIRFAISFAALFAPVVTAGAAQGTLSSEPFVQEFIVTVYYSPLPYQCCYVKGSFEEDVILNGRGTNGADGTEVYPGMAAAPKSYPFGTRIQLPGLGTVTVHDRGGAITELPGSHRLDLWVGHGEEGLSRALAFGVKRIRGTVYPRGSIQPGERLELASLPAPIDILRSFMGGAPDLLALRPGEGDRGLSVELLQEHLRDAGYFRRPVSGFFGDQTKQAFTSFLSDVGLKEPSHILTERSAAYLLAAAKRREADDPLSLVVNQYSKQEAVVRAKRTLRFLGYYRGRTNGIYDAGLQKAIFAFQKEHGLVGSEKDPGAGRIGPLTRRKVIASWQRRLIAKRAKVLLALREIDRAMRAKGLVVARFLSEGDRGSDVRILQRFLAARGHIPPDALTGFFGPVTRQGLIVYQVETGLVKSASDRGAGIAGPATVMSLRRAQRTELYRLVREKGWKTVL